MAQANHPSERLMVLDYRREAEARCGQMIRARDASAKEGGSFREKTKSLSTATHSLPHILDTTRM